MLKNSSLILLSLATLVTMCCGARVFNDLDFESVIVNGKTATRGQFPFYVFVRMFLKDGRSSSCGGTLINSRWVLTAGHCVRFKNLTVDHFELHFGAHNRTDLNEKGRLILTTKRSIPHPKLTLGPTSNDVALLRLDKPIQFTNFIKPVDLSETKLEAGAKVTAIGLGVTQTKGQPADLLQFAELTHITRRECARTFPFLSGREDVICARGGDRGKESPCNGDSGGPLVVKTDKGLTLVGATSFGSKTGCHLGYPGAFANVQLFLQWIRDTVAKN